MTSALSRPRDTSHDARERPSSLGKPGVRVIYIMGYGHSGSTLLNAMLAEAHDVVGVGELASLSSAGWLENGIQDCACGVAVRDCAFWEAVGSKWKRLTGEKDFAAIVALRRYFRRWRARRAAHRWIPEADSAFADVGRLMCALYQSIGDVSGRNVIVDCSKSAGRARFLARIPQLDARVIHLVRDSRAVAWSMLKRNTSVLRTAVAWRLHNRLCDGVRRAMPPSRSCLVRYEDLMFRTAETLQRIEQCADLDLQPLVGRVVRSEPIRFRHEVGGNRVRRTRLAHLTPDVAWAREMPRDRQQLVWLLDRTMLRAYGYGRTS